MTSFLIYLFPAIMDMILPAVFFMAQVYTAEHGGSPSTVANFITLWAAVYMVTAFLIGRIVTPRNAAGLILFSAAMTAALSIAFAATTDVRTMYVLTTLEGVGMAAFFVPFQVFMKQVGDNHQRSLNASVGLYTFSWSIGYAAGPFAAALLWTRLGWSASHLLCAAAALLVGVLTWHLKHAASTDFRAPSAKRGDQPEMETPGESVREGILEPATATTATTTRGTGLHVAPVCSRWGRLGPSSCGTGVSPVGCEDSGMLSRDETLPDLAWMGWLFSGIGCMAIRMITGLFPSSGVVFALPKDDQGFVLFVLSIAQAGVGLGLSRFRRWMYQPAPILVFGMFGVAGLYLFSTAHSTSSFALAAGCFGVYSGSFFYYLVFHSLAHPQRSGRYVSVNEAVVGLTSIAGPLLGGIVAERLALGTAYLLTAGVLVIAVSVQFTLHRAIAGRAAAPPPPASSVSSPEKLPEWA